MDRGTVAEFMMISCRDGVETFYVFALPCHCDLDEELWQHNELGSSVFIPTERSSVDKTMKLDALTYKILIGR